MIQTGDRVLALLDMLVVKGTTTTTFGTRDLIEGRNVWKTPLDDATVERLARSLYVRRKRSQETPWDQLLPVAQNCIKDDVRAVIAELIGDTP